MEKLKLYLLVVCFISFNHFLFPQAMPRTYHPYEKGQQNLITGQNSGSIPAPDPGVPSEQGVPAYSAENQHNMKFAPGEIIVKYRSASYKDARNGLSILSEYEGLKKEIEVITSQKISTYKPVYSEIVNRMIEKNMPELQVKQELLNGKNLNKVTSSNAAEAFLLQEFSRCVLIKFNDYEIDPVETAKQIAESSRLTNAGFIIEYAEPNFIYYTTYTVNDPYYSTQWAHTKTQAAAGWDIQRGNSNIKIGIIDTGIDYLHEDLTGNYYSVLSYDFVNIDTSYYKSAGYIIIPGEDYTGLDNNPMDYNGHGTHVAGIVGASANNGKGVAGVVHNCSLIALRAGFSIINSGSEQGALENDDIANAILHAISNGIDILNMSFGGSDSQTLKEVIKTASQSGIVLVAAAGNSSSDVMSYPAAFDNVISVSATTNDDKRASFSNYGKWIDIAAPGNGIQSTIPKTGGSLTRSSGYRFLNGTSMASPYVAGLAALLLSKDPSLTPAQIEYIIKKSADIPAENVNYIGAGRVNILKALQLNNIKTNNLDASITTPSDNEFATGNINFSGTASGSEYILEIGYGLYPANWTLINRGTSVSNDILGTLNAAGLADGKYTVRLTTWNLTDEKETRVVIRIASIADIHPGFPLTVTYINNFAISDLDGDGFEEIIAIRGASSSFSNSVIYVYNSSGEIQQGFPQQFPNDGRITGEPAIADINNDGINEIIVIGYYWFSGEPRPKDMLVVYNYNGSIPPGWPKFINYDKKGFDCRTQLAVSDIDRNGYLDIVLTTESQVHAFNGDGTYLSGWPLQINSPYQPRCPLVITNLDSDPELEISFTQFNTSAPNTELHYTAAYNHDASVVAGFPYNQTAWGWCLAAGDINNDGNTEIVTQNGPISNTGNKLPFSTNMHSYSPFAIANVNDDPFLELLYGDGNGKAYLCKYNGQVLPGWPKGEQEFTADATNIIADIAGDDKPEIIVPWTPNTVESSGKKPGLYAYNIDGTIVPGFPKLVDVFTIDKVCVGDIDNDGLTELIAIGESKIFVFDMEKSYNKNIDRWQRYQHDPWLTGLNSNPGNTLLTDFQLLTVNEDDTLNLQISPVYNNWNKYTVQTYSNNQNISPVVNNGVLSLPVESNWNGENNISVSVSNGQLVDSTSFGITVLPVNDPPFLLSSLPDTIINEDDSSTIIIQDFMQHFSDVDVNDRLNFSALALDAGLDSLVIRTSEISIPGAAEEVSQSLFSVSLIAYPSKNFAGIVNIAVTAVDDSMAQISDTLQLKVNPVNDTPIIAGISDAVIAEDDSLVISLNATDADYDSLHVWAIPSEENLNLAVLYNNFTIKPLRNWNGNASVTVYAADRADTALTTFQITVLPGNDPPEMAHTLPAVMLNEDDSSTILISNLAYYFSDADLSDSLVFAASAAGPGLDSLKIVRSFLIHNSQNEYISKKSGTADEHETLGEFENPIIFSLLAFPRLDFNGKVKVLVTATDDSLASITDTLELTIDAVNDKPMDFSILYPADTFKIFLTDSILVDSLQFAWHPSHDIDSDLVKYTFAIWEDSVNLLTVPEIMDTLFALPYSHFLNWTHDDTTCYKWAVSAYDSYDTTYCAGGFNTLLIFQDVVGVPKTEIPNTYALYQNYPNPFNPSTNIRFAIKEKGMVRLKVYDVLGAEVATLIDQELQAGIYNAVFSVSAASGIYFYVLEAGNFMQVMKMMLLK